MGVVQVNQDVVHRESKNQELADHPSKDEKDVQAAVNDVKIFSKLGREAKNLNIHDKFLQGMATCHSLTTIDGKLSGDPIDVIMFEGTGWRLEEAIDSNAQANDVRNLKTN